MKTIITSFIFSFWCLISTAQTTAIPDPAFEQALINLEIDSDGILNGQVLTSDISSVTELNLYGYNNISELTGIEDFENLEFLTIVSSNVSSINVNANLKLKRLNCSSNNLTMIDVSNNQLLEKLNVGNSDDVGPFNHITDLDLSNNPNINTIAAYNMTDLNVINLKNGNNNENISISIGFDFSGGQEPQEPLNTVCIQVDNEDIAQNNQFPYSEWNIDDAYVAYNFSENCALSTSKLQKNNIVTLYPNPATNVVNITSRESVTEAAIYNLLGQKVKQLPTGTTILTTDVSSLTIGTYFVMVKTSIGNTTLKVIIN